MFRCIYTGKRYGCSSAEHILQNSLGARWVCDYIVCDELQRSFGKTIDVAVADAVAPIRNLFDAPTGRGNPPPILRHLPTSSGHHAALEPGGVFQIEEPRIERVSDNEVIVTLRSEGQLGHAEHLLKQRFPGCSFQHGTPRTSPPPPAEQREKVKIRMMAGGEAYHRGVLKAAFNMLGALRLPVHDPAFDALRGYVRDGGGNGSEFVRFATANAFSPPRECGPCDHVMAITVRDRRVDGMIQLFSATQHVIRLATSYSGPAFNVCYIVDPLREAEPPEHRGIPFDASSLPDFDLQPALPGPAIWEWYTTRLMNVMERWRVRRVLSRLKPWFDEAQAKGEPLDREVARAAVARILHEELG